MSLDDVFYGYVARLHVSGRYRQREFAVKMESVGRDKGTNINCLVMLLKVENSWQLQD